MNNAFSLLALMGGLLLQAPALGYEESSYAAKPDLFFARVGESTEISLATGAAATKLRAACKSGQLFRVESGPPTCKCVANSSEGAHPEILTIALHCQTIKGGPKNGALVLASASTIEFDETSLGQAQRMNSSSANSILKFLKTIDPDLRKQQNVNSLAVYPVLAQAQQYWLIHTKTTTIRDVGCSRRKFQIVAKRGQSFEFLGEAYDIDSIVRLKPDGHLMLRAANQCDGTQADLYSLDDKIGVRATFAGH